MVRRHKRLKTRVYHEIDLFGCWWWVGNTVTKLSDCSLPDEFSSCRIFKTKKKCTGVANHLAKTIGADNFLVTKCFYIGDRRWYTTYVWRR